MNEKIKKQLLFLFSTVIIIRLLLLFAYHETWWDAAVYVGMGKFFWSAGASGLWEPIRPIVWPILLGGLDKVGSALLLGKIVQAVIGIATTYLVFLIGKKAKNEWCGLIAATLFGLSQLHLLMTFHNYTELIATFFIVLGTTAYIQNKTNRAGMYTGLAFLSKFPAVINGLAIIIRLLQRKKRSKLKSFAIITALTTTPLFILNYLTTGNATQPVFQASHIIREVVGCNILHQKAWFFYFSRTLQDSLVHLFFIVGLWIVVTKWRKINETMKVTVISTLLMGAYFIALPCRDERYLLLMLPFICIITAYGLTHITKKKWYTLTFLTVFLYMLLSSTMALQTAEPEGKNWVHREYYEYLSGKNISGDVWSANPKHVLYSDKRIRPLYYPLYTTERIRINKKLITKSNNTAFILLDSCEGGMICNPDDKECKKETEIFINWLKKEFTMEYYKEAGRCEYYIFTGS